MSLSISEIGFSGIPAESIPYLRILKIISNPKAGFIRHMKSLNLSRLKARDGYNDKRKQKWLSLPPERREEELAKRRAWRAANKDAVNAKRREMYAASPEIRAKVKAWNANYKAKKKETKG